MTDVCPKVQKWPKLKNRNQKRKSKV